jgi:hypothetical protein
MTDSTLATLQNIIETLYNEYQTDEFMESKLQHYIVELPQLLKNIKKNNHERRDRIVEISNEQQQFISHFLNTHSYFYNTTTEKFFHYDKLHYSVICEDDVLYHILSSITKENSCLLSWKQKTKVNIIKRIKEKPIVKYAPESDTIQFVLNLFAPFFSSKTEIKYFLTILGDSILKKPAITLPVATLAPTLPITSLPLHFLNSKAKSFLQELNSLCNFYIGGNILQSIKYKYHDTHPYSQCRFLTIQMKNADHSLWKNIFEYALDVFCVSCHYSMRYNSSDDFLMKYSNDNQLISKVSFLKDKTPEMLVEQFMDEYIQIVPSNITVENQFTAISWKSMLYLWKNFLESKELPAIIFQDSLKNILISQYGEQYANDQFIGITSKYLPLVHNFIDFWNIHIQQPASVQQENNDNTSSNGLELEIEEIRMLFKRTHFGLRENITDKQIIDILTYFFPHIEIVSDKYIYGISSNLWDKDLDIEICVQSLINNHLDSLDLDEKYLYYCKYYSDDLDNHLLVSKSYFERFFNL